MRRPSSLHLPDRLARGRITWVSLLLLVALVGGGYLALTYVPVYWLHVEVKQVVRDYMNQAIKNKDDAVLVEMMIHKIRVLDSQERLDDRGKIVKVPTIQLQPREVTWTRDTSSQPNTLRVAFEYTRVVEYPFTGRWTEKTLAVDLTNDLERADWGPAR